MIGLLDWSNMLVGDAPWTFFLEIVFRAGTMFLFMILFFRISGKKEMRQLNVYDLIVIIALGSAAGDPMFYEDVPLLHCLLVFVVVLGLYRLITWLSLRNHKLDVWLEGDTRCVFSDNTILIKDLHREGLTAEELLAALRQEKISQLGQVDRVYIEASGHFSIFFRDQDATVEGLPIFPEELEQGVQCIENSGKHACVKCGQIREFSQGERPVCTHCETKHWLPVTRRKRVT